MSFSAKIFKLSIFLIALLILSLSNSFSQTQDIVVRIDNVSAYPGQTGVKVPVYLDNYNYFLAGFVMRIAMEQIDRGSFQLGYDLEGTLIDYWEVADIIHLGGHPYEIKSIGIADYIIPQQETPPLAPQSNGPPLLNLLVDVADIPDTATNRLINLKFVANDIQDINFTDPAPRLIGIAADSTLDTLWYDCTNPSGDSCLEWTEVSGPPADSMEIFWVYDYYLDPDVVGLNDGSILVKVPLCGDVNGDLEIDVSDIVYLIQSLYLDGPPPLAPRAANMNASPDGAVDISDIVTLIKHLYIDGKPLECFTEPLNN